MSYHRPRYKNGQAVVIVGPSPFGGSVGIVKRWSPLLERYLVKFVNDGEADYFAANELRSEAAAPQAKETTT